jgi:N-acylneuraminate cytidylyltransferase
MIIAIIPARGGSKGIPRKNVQPVAGKPLIAHSIEQALHAKYVDRVIVSTDDREIGDVALHHGAEVIWRPAALSGDTATSESALLHVLDALEGDEPDLVVFLQCTSPLRQPDDIDRAIDKLREESADSLLSVVQSHHWVWRLEDGVPDSFNFDYKNRPRRQERVPEFDENGSIYVFKPTVLRTYKNRLGGKIALYPMDDWSTVDIDTPHDLTLCDWIMTRRQRGDAAAC